jgi:2-succinyl-5-enolpyruvyl-6-hydroxy-3-cyclohexene-1-carboxylate synthase
MYEEVLDNEGGSILEALNAARIVSFVVTPNGVNIIEACDNYYSITLTASQFDRFIEELRALTTAKTTAQDIIDKPKSA